MNDNDQQQKLNEALARAALDGDFRERLIADPNAVLTHEGIEIPEGLSIELVEVSTAKMVLTLPPVDNEPMSDAELAEVDGGFMPKWRFNQYMNGDSELFRFGLPPVQNQNHPRGTNPPQIQE
ncbi:MAG: NHLP leader peptide family RiPP precursor [Candidatus Nanopelagicales bacterium]